MRRILLALFVLFDLLLLYLVAWPVPIRPEAWQPPTPVPFEPTGSLADIEIIPLPDGHGPEDVEVDPLGRIYAGLHDGRILRWETPDREPLVFSDTGGRPLGLHWDLSGNLIVADALKGLLRVGPDGTITVLATQCGGTPLVFTDDLEIAADGTIWFSDASTRFGQPEWNLDILENRASGRLCAWNPATGEARQVLDGLYFANGIAVDPDQQFVLVNETSRYRVRKLWIAGEKKGQNEVLIDNLPGFPDGISTGTDGVFWIAVASPRNDFLDLAADKPFLRSLVVRLPEAMKPKPDKTARAIGVRADGTVAYDLFDPLGTRLELVTSVQERDGWLYLGSLIDDVVGRVRRP